MALSVNEKLICKNHANGFKAFFFKKKPWDILKRIVANISDLYIETTINYWEVSMPHRQAYNV